MVFKSIPLRGGGGGEVQAFHFGKTDFELGVGGEGQDTSRHFEGSLGSRANFGFGLKIFLEAKIKNRPLLVCAKSIFTLILKNSDKFIEKCRRRRLFGESTLRQNGVLRYGHFSYFLEY